MDDVFPQVYGLLLAAGLSRRLPPNKLLLPLGEKTILQRAVVAVTASKVVVTVVVVGHEADRVEVLLNDCSCITVFNPDYEKGMGYSVIRGVEYIGERFCPPSGSGILLCLGDEPFLSSGLINSIIDAYDCREEKIVIPNFLGRRGHPTVFPFHFLQQEKELVRRKGARSVVRLYPGRIKDLEINTDAIISDIDTPQDYHRHLTDLAPNQARRQNEKN